MDPKDIKAIVFDMDGTLVNSEPLHMKAWKSTIEKWQLHYPNKWYEQWVGQSDWDMSRWIVKQNDLAITPEEFLRQKRELFRMMARRELAAFDGVQAGLQKLRGIKMGIATSSSRADAIMALTMTHLISKFQVVIASDDVKNFKPHPEAYLNAAEAMEVEATACIAIEDSISGLQSAKSAGMYTIGVANSIGRAQLNQADLVFDSTVLAIKYLYNLTRS